ncbi:hypothetical protein DM01DRAFT_1335321 [Hesseltinella vesiculosa]|uniref:Zn(2)-C6 fungal-type domain-containing protein n=1 Tax=Hesseltinella vesiculosa TaxID=101127 RepID=A0A1X2GJ71_9FUNG|nr:hypothetical protein DM01DRAFT_1335321 [Hesseltinella vesiculosa]
MANTQAASSANANKDLSCLRCRKKKAKCSKTRPTCTRCERSNQPCEYPDAPPNLTDLSQKVLGLYESLRDLEGEFLVKYLQQDQDQDSPSPSPPPTTVDTLASPPPVLPPQPLYQPSLGESESKEVRWSMTLLGNGMSIQTTVKTAFDLIVLMSRLNQQLFEDPDTSDDPMAREWALTTEDKDNEDEELDEDEYLVTVPLFPLSYFSLHQSLSPAPMPSAACPQPPCLSPQAILDHILLAFRHDDISRSLNDSLTSSHGLIVRLLLDQLKPSLPPKQNTPPLAASLDSLQPLQRAVLLAAFLTCHLFLQPSVLLGPSCSVDTLHQLLLQALLDSVFDAVQPSDRDALRLSMLLFLWCPIPASPDALSIQPATISNWLTLCWRWVLMHDPPCATPTISNKETMVASLLYLDVFYHTFLLPDVNTSSRDTHLGVILDLAESTPNNLRYRCRLCLTLQAQLMRFLSQVQSLFYIENDRSKDASDTLDKALIRARLQADVPLDTDGNESPRSVKAETMEDDNPVPSASVTASNVRKVDVDEVLMLVRDLEKWEQRLPDWAAWPATTDTSDRIDSAKNETSSPTMMSPMVVQLHLILNMVKVLLFRPFSTPHRHHQDSEQTHTRTTFLDLSLHAADRLSRCLTKNCTSPHDSLDPFWSHAAQQMTWDVVDRVKAAFDRDPEIKTQLCTLVNRLDV